MIHHFKKALLSLCLTGGLLSGQVVAQKKLFPEAPGIVSYTYRNQFAKDVPGTLDMIKNLG